MKYFMSHSQEPEKDSTGLGGGGVGGQLTPTVYSAALRCPPQAGGTQTAGELTEHQASPKTTVTAISSSHPRPQDSCSPEARIPVKSVSL